MAGVAVDDDQQRRAGSGHVCESGRRECRRGGAGRDVGRRPGAAVGGGGCGGCVRRVRVCAAHTAGPDAYHAGVVRAVLAGPAVPPLSEADERARASLVEADDCVRTSREELGFAEAAVRSRGRGPVRPGRAGRRVRAVGRLPDTAAVRRRRPEDEASRRHALAGIVGRCQEAGRRLDAEATGFDRLRALERDGLDGALEPAEARFRELAARTGAVDAIPAGLGERYRPLGGRSRHRLRRAGQGPSGVRHDPFQSGPPEGRHGGRGGRGPSSAGRRGCDGPGRRVRDLRRTARRRPDGGRGSGSGRADRGGGGARRRRGRRARAAFRSASCTPVPRTPTSSWPPYGKS